MLMHVIILVALGINLIQAVSLDEAKDELERARTAVLRAIQSADINLDSHYERFERDSSNVELEGQIVIEYEEQIIHGQVTAIKQVAEQAGRDISSCLGNYEEDVSNTTNVVINEMKQCINNEIDEAATIITESKYLVDITINRIDALGYQLGLCDADNEECITPLYELIRWERLYRPEHIEIQILRANNLLNQLRVIVQECSNLYVTEYVTYTNAFLKEVADCADSVIG